MTDEKLLNLATSQTTCYASTVPLGHFPLHGGCGAAPRGGPAIDWVIVGGESGHGARYMNPIWVRSLIDQCRDAGVFVFMKQTGAVLAREWKLRDKAHGGYIAEWPKWMQVREFPIAAEHLRAVKI